MDGIYSLLKTLVPVQSCGVVPIDIENKKQTTTVNIEETSTSDHDVKRMATNMDDWCFVRVPRIQKQKL